MNLPAHSVFNFAFEGMERQYMLVNPPAVSTAKLPPSLIVLLHPFRGTPESTLEQFVALHKRGFTLLLPYGHERSWNAGACCGKAKELELNDSTFIQLISQIVAAKVGAQRRLFVAGYSNGAFMTSKLALEALATSNKEPWMSGIAMISGYSYEEALYAEALATPQQARFPVLGLHGMKDESVRFEGCCPGKQCCCEITAKQCLAFDQSMQNWAQINDEEGDSAFRQSGGGGGFDFFTFSSYSQQQCFHTQSVYYCQFPEAPHRLPSHIPEAVELVAAFFLKEIDMLYEGNKTRPSLLLLFVLLLVATGGILLVRRLRGHHRSNDG